MNQMNDRDMLNYICKATEMGIDSIKDVLQFAKEPEICKALKEQKEEYTNIYSSAYSMLLSKGEKPKDVSRMAKMSASLSIKSETLLNKSPAKIAEMMIQGNTMGLTKSIQHIRDYSGQNEQIRTLATKLMKTEEANIEQMKAFL